MTGRRVVVIGAGIGGLSAASILAARGFDVTVIEAASAPGGKMREVLVAGRPIDSGPTVFTMRHVFEAIFAETGSLLSASVSLAPLSVLARHSWLGATQQGPSRLDLHADRVASAGAIDRLAGQGEGARYLAFCDRARDMHDTLAGSFMTVDRPGQVELVRRAGIAAMLRTRPFSSMWAALGSSFRDPRLRQLFGRYATYCGSSPFLAPATLMLIAHVEQEGVWLVEGGMHRLAQALAARVTANGGTLHFNRRVTRIHVAHGRATGVETEDGQTIPADRVVSNVDANAIASGLLGEAARRAAPATAFPQRALSAVTFSALARTDGFPLVRHNVFFSRDYRTEFDALTRHLRMPDEPTVYICAQDRDDSGTHPDAGPERLLILVNAPPTGDRAVMTAQEIDQCQQRTFAFLARHGLRIELAAPAVATTPDRFEALFPATGGALYGRATHGAMASFTRPASRSAVPGLYLTGGSVHPGAGVPMVALSGRIAASNILQDCGLMPLSPLAAMLGGMSTPSAMMAPTASAS